MKTLNGPFFVSMLRSGATNLELNRKIVNDLNVFPLLMMSSVTKMKFDGDIADSVGGFMAVTMMPLTYSIANGIMFGIMTWVILKVCTGKSQEVSPIMWVIFVLFALRILTLVTNFM